MKKGKIPLLTYIESNLPFVKSQNTTFILLLFYFQRGAKCTHFYTARRRRNKFGVFFLCQKYACYTHVYTARRRRNFFCFFFVYQKGASYTHFYTARCRRKNIWGKKGDIFTMPVESKTIRVFFVSSKGASYKHFWNLIFPGKKKRIWIGVVFFLIPAIFLEKKRTKLLKNTVLGSAAKLKLLLFVQRGILSLFDHKFLDFFPKLVITKWLRSAVITKSKITFFPRFLVQKVT